MSEANAVETLQGTVTRADQHRAAPFISISIAAPFILLYAAPCILRYLPPPPRSNLLNQSGKSQSCHRVCSKHY